MEILRCENITKTYMNGGEETKVLDDVSFSVEAGEFVSVVGPSGSGKSTLLHILGGVDRPTSGKVLISGTDIHSLGENRLAILRRRQIGLVYQFYNLLPVLNVDENILLPHLLDGRKPDKERLDANVIKLKRQEVVLAEMLDRISDTFSILAEVREVELDISCPDGATVVCDDSWTTEALSNIVKNALEHTPAGGKVSVTVSQNNFFTDIVISDTGEGISPEDRDKIFTRFYKGENSSPESVGIGLAMAKQIISLENGTITVSSTPGEGTAFTVRLYSDIVA